MSQGLLLYTVCGVWRVAPHTTHCTASTWMPLYCLGTGLAGFGGGSYPNQIEQAIAIKILRHHLLDVGNLDRLM